MNTDKPWRPGDVKSGMHNEGLFVWHSDGTEIGRKKEFVLCGQPETQKDGKHYCNFKNGIHLRD